MQRNLLGRWLSHYMPAWTAIFLVVFPILIGNAVRPKPAAAKVSADPVEEVAPVPTTPKWAADVNLGLLSFWVWALMTNAHDGRLVRSSGQREAADTRERQQEFAVILCFLFLTVGLYIFCNTALPTPVALILTSLSVVLPVIVLGRPEP